jgi:hypothetical protein
MSYVFVIFDRNTEAMKSPKYPLLIHLLCCVAFLALPYIFAPSGFASVLRVFDSPHERTNFLAYFMMLGFFYAHYYYLIPRYYFGERYITYVISISLSLAVILLTLTYLDRADLFSGSGIGDPPPPVSTPSPLAYPAHKPPFGFELSHALFLFLVGLFVSLALRINSRLRQIEQEKLNAELSYLKAQINPHFLFNTLNSIYSMAILRSERTAEAIVKLSALMRYVMREADQTLVPLAQEIEYISHYVALQQMRLGDTVQVEFSVSGQASPERIAPLLLISFIENAFKYGVNPQEKSVIILTVGIQGSRLHLHTFNKKVRVFHDQEASSGIGIDNTKARLNLHYPQRYALRIQDTVSHFSVDLTLQL